MTYVHTFSQDFAVARALLLTPNPIPYPWPRTLPDPLTPTPCPLPLFPHSPYLLGRKLAGAELKKRDLWP